MVIVGRIFDIVVINERVAQIVLKKKMNDKIVPVAITVFGYWKDRALKEMNLKMKDKIKGNVYMKSKIYNGKYYTDVYFKEVYLVDEIPPKPTTAGDLFPENFLDTEDGVVDTDTGELLS
jgi:hypothetical protein